MDETAQQLEYFESWDQGVDIFTAEGFSVWDLQMDVVSGRWIVGTDDLRNPGQQGPSGINRHDQLGALWNAWEKLRDNPQAFRRATGTTGEHP